VTSRQHNITIYDVSENLSSMVESDNEDNKWIYIDFIKGTVPGEPSISDQVRQINK
jgi:hypothetical protein